MSDTTTAAPESGSQYAPATRLHPVVKMGAYASAGTALLSLCAHISMPLGFTPVPLTLQPFAILLLGLLLEPFTAFTCLLMYLIEGASGLPVFSPHGVGGVAQLLGPTGGYLLGAPIAALSASMLARCNKGFWRSLGAAAAGEAVLLLAGAAWLGVYEHVAARVLLAQSVAPFLLTDSLKVIAAALCATTLLSFRLKKAL